MDVVHGINLDTSHSMADIEQGDTAIFSITITNTGNVHDAFVFWDPNSLEGQQEWLLPFGWQVNFPIRVELDPGQSVTKNLEVFVPTSEDPGAFVIYVKGWSEGEPIKSVEKGTYDILELGVFVSIRSTGTLCLPLTTAQNKSSPANVLPTTLKSQELRQRGTRLCNARCARSQARRRGHGRLAPGELGGHG